MSRPAGIIAAVGIPVTAGLPLLRDIGWRKLIVMALAAAPSLAFGLFFAAAVFPGGPLPPSPTSQRRGRSRRG